MVGHLRRLAWQVAGDRFWPEHRNRDRAADTATHPVFYQPPSTAGLYCMRHWLEAGEHGSAKEVPDFQIDLDHFTRMAQRRQDAAVVTSNGGPSWDDWNAGSSSSPTRRITLIQRARYACLRRNTGPRELRCNTGTRHQKIGLCPYSHANHSHSACSFQIHLNQAIVSRGDNEKAAVRTVE